MMTVTPSPPFPLSICMAAAFAPIIPRHSAWMRFASLWFVNFTL